MSCALFFAAAFASLRSLASLLILVAMSSKGPSCSNMDACASFIGADAALAIIAFGFSGEDVESFVAAAAGYLDSFAADDKDVDAFVAGAAREDINPFAADEDVDCFAAANEDVWLFFAAVEDLGPCDDGADTALASRLFLAIRSRIVLRMISAWVNGFFCATGCVIVVVDVDPDVVVLFLALHCLITNSTRSAHCPWRTCSCFVFIASPRVNGGAPFTRTRTSIGFHRRWSSTSLHKKLIKSEFTAAST